MKVWPRTGPKILWVFMFFSLFGLFNYYFFHFLRFVFITRFSSFSVHTINEINKIERRFPLSDWALLDSYDIKPGKWNSISTPPKQLESFCNWYKLWSLESSAAAECQGPFCNLIMDQKPNLPSKVSATSHSTLTVSFFLKTPQTSTELNFSFLSQWNQRTITTWSNKE